MRNTPAARLKRTPRNSGHPIGLRGHRVRDLGLMQQRRKEILLGSARAFAQGGFDATNMDDIARECGLGKGHIYFYFPSKEEIFAEIRAGAIALALKELLEIVSAGLGDPMHTLRSALSTLIAGVFQPQGRYAIVLADPVSLSRANRNRIRTLQRQYEQTFAGILRAGIAKGEFIPGDPKLMTFVILRAANSVATWYREGGEWKPEWIVRQVTDQLVRSVCEPVAGRRGALNYQNGAVERRRRSVERASSDQMASSR